MVLWQNLQLLFSIYKFVKFIIGVVGHKVKWYNFIVGYKIMEYLEENMNEQDYELLIDLYKTKNITRTAQELFLTQPAVTKRLQNIERELKNQIILRSKHGIAFTPVGESLIPHARKILEESRKFRELAVSSSGEIQGNLWIGSSLTFAHYRLPEVIRKFHAKYPKVRIHLITTQSRILIEKLRQNEITLAIARGDHFWEEATELLDQESMYFICSFGNKKRPLPEYPYLHHRGDLALERSIYQWLQEKKITDIRSDYDIDVDTCRELARLGLGWSILPGICLDQFEGYKEEIKLADGSVIHQKSRVLCKNINAGLPQVQLFIEELKEDARQRTEKRLVVD